MKILDIWLKIKSFFKVKKPLDPIRETKTTEEYRKKDEINIAYQTSNKISNMVTLESTVSITPPGARVDMLNKEVNKFWRKNIKRITSRMLGEGECVVAPYLNNGKLFKNVVSKANIVYLNDNGELPTECIIISPPKMVNSYQFNKLLHYQLDENGNQLIETLFYNDGEISNVPDVRSGWEEQEPTVISNTDRLLIARYICPTDPRTDNILDTANITDGCKDLILEFKGAFEYIINEYDLKKTFLGVDETLVKRRDDGTFELNETHVFKLFNPSIKEKMFEVFDPEIRQDPIYKRLLNAGEMLEARMGLSRGIITQQADVSQYTNEANIKRSMYDTYAFVHECRTAVEDATKDFVYACNVLAEYAGLTAQGVSFDDIEVTFSWSNAMTETPTEEFAQLAEMVVMGAKTTEDVLAWHDNITVEEAKAIIENREPIDNANG